MTKADERELAAARREYGAANRAHSLEVNRPDATPATFLRASRRLDAAARRLVTAAAQAGASVPLYARERVARANPARTKRPHGSTRPKRAHAKRSRIRKPVHAKRSRARRNTPLEVSGRDARVGRRAVLMSDEVVDLTYRHVQSSQSKPYRHPFGRGVRMFALADGSILLKHSDPRRRLWEDRLVGDDA